MKICPKCHSSYGTLVCQHCAMAQLFESLCQREQRVLPMVAADKLPLHTVSSPGVKHLRLFLEPRMTFCAQIVGSGWRAGSLKFSDTGEKRLCHACLTQFEKLLAELKEHA